MYVLHDSPHFYIQGATSWQSWEVGKAMLFWQTGKINFRPVLRLNMPGVRVITGTSHVHDIKPT